MSWLSAAIAGALVAWACCFVRRWIWDVVVLGMLTVRGVETGSAQAVTWERLGAGIASSCLIGAGVMPYVTITEKDFSELIVALLAGGLVLAWEQFGMWGQAAFAGGWTANDPGEKSLSGWPIVAMCMSVMPLLVLPAMIMVLPMSVVAWLGQWPQWVIWGVKVPVIGWLIGLAMIWQGLAVVPLAVVATIRFVGTLKRNANGAV